MVLPPEALRRRPEEAVRRIALGLLDEARDALARLQDPSDREALHAFRVAIRRLRSTLQLWRPVLRKSVARRHEKALRKLQKSTGRGRDAEVALEWLDGQRGTLAPDELLGLDWLAAELGSDRARAGERAGKELAERFETLERELRHGLARMYLVVELDDDAPPPRFADALAARARSEARRLARRVGSISSVDDREHCHRARIAGKRLRYLVEPARECGGGARLVKRLKKIQDVLGDINDAHVLSDELGSALAESASERARLLHELARENPSGRRLAEEAERSERRGLIELTRRTELRARRLFGVLQRDWLGRGIEELLEAVELFASGLERLASAEPGVEIERKFLLDAFPELEAARAAGQRIEVWEVEQGWLPGERLRERVRRVRRVDASGDGAGEWFTRTLKLGRGLTRSEIEEPASASLFRSLWPLTEGCRIHKRRHRVHVGEQVWEIDVFHGRELVLAEIELADADERVEPPSWLAPHVVREVTDDPSYTNLKLAR